jgi:hypothetical protein
MRQAKFKTHEEYLAWQTKGVEHRLKRRGDRGDVKAQEIQGIYRYLDSKLPGAPMMGMCHGAAHGLEVDLFREFLPGVDILGTDWFPLRNDIIRYDFHQEVERWVGKFDFVYTNSLDHAKDPKLCIKVWTNQLRESGLLFVTWSINSVQGKLGRRPRPGGDCFGACLDEYIDLIDKEAQVRDLLYCKPDRHYRVTIVAGKRT